MNSDDSKYLILRGKNKDIYFIQKRLSKNLASIMGKDFIKKSLETKNIDIARKKRDEILAELDLTAKNTANIVNIHNSIDETLKDEDFYVPTEKNRESGNTLDKIDGKNLNHSKLRDFSWNKKDLIIKIDKFIPIGILVLTLLIAFFA